METGNKKQQEAYAAIKNLDILKHLKSYTPVLCGTLPIGIDITSSDLDIIMEVHDFNLFEEKVKALYSNKKNFKVKRITIRGREVVKSNFIFNNFEFELFGQSTPVHKQNAYLHMIIEHNLMENDPSLKEEVIKLKKQGYKTEPAFCKVLNITGDSYSGLIQFGVKQGIITD
ncbi:DUF4269 domain-containing protein [Pontibacillus marinus]|uniref:Alpha/beta hydrolase n=1 Tax=Pontibacillus marinus BH030004 = DSM 16465 TaxID=1385511 RepID=A0A0A5G7H4_9BACI|nr:DUF4269 domain-containing protein [Pontibacillus marinus]KGX87128.1 alpha/beta hydrolase [Pontibacillus marinus BH030004 = DSM 16465]